MALGFLAYAVASISMRGLGLVAMQTLMFVLADTGGPASIGQRPGDAGGGAPGDDRRLIRAGLGAYGG